MTKIVVSLRSFFLNTLIINMLKLKLPVVVVPILTLNPFFAIFGHHKSQVQWILFLHAQRYLFILK
jgi:hypothetical protein